jgi:Domain of unknown function (DUF4390)
MMAFTTHFWKKHLLKLLVRLSCTLGLLFASGFSLAEVGPDSSQLSVERAEDDVLVSVQVQFELPSAVEDALQKGLPLFFVTETDILRARWYWYDKKIVGAERQLRLAFQPLTRRWKLTATSGASKGSNLGLSLNQTFDSLPLALAAIKRISRWKIAEIADLDASQNYRVEFRFKLDLSRLPLPFQIGTIGQTDWNVAIYLAAPLSLDLTK